jgi:hypothetical protein
MASATVNMSRQLGGALGASITGTILTSGHAAGTSIANAFVSSLHTAVLIPGFAGLLAAVAAAALIRARPALA